MRTRILIISSAFTLAFLFTLAISPVWAGCGCDKPPPEPGPIVPDATYPGTSVRLYDEGFVPGRAYTVSFEGVGSVEAVAGIDQEKRKRLVVTIPDTCRVGPTAVKVLDTYDSGMSKTIPSSQFTLVNQPLRVSEEEGLYVFKGYRAAVDAQGRIVMAFDMTDVREPRNFLGKFENKGLRMKSVEDADFFNIQGYLMTDFATYDLPYHVPGLNKHMQGKGQGSDMVLYWRHEFHSWNDAHGPGSADALSPDDADYHLDGTRHVDHNHIIFKALGTHGNGGALKPGSIDNLSLSIAVFADGDQMKILEFKKNPSVGGTVINSQPPQCKPAK